MSYNIVENRNSNKTVEFNYH